jgi:hypothetical protein
LSIFRENNSFPNYVFKLVRVARDVIGRVKDEILVANPYVECCYLTTVLQEARDKRNLYSGSAGGGVLEAGIVSFESKVADSKTKYITDLLEKTESPA